MFVPAKTSSVGLVSVSIKSMFVCNRFHAKLVDGGRNLAL